MKWDRLWSVPERGKNEEENNLRKTYVASCPNIHSFSELEGEFTISKEKFSMGRWKGGNRFTVSHSFKERKTEKR